MGLDGMDPALNALDVMLMRAKTHSLLLSIPST
jgi:hypothetical protein